MMQWTGSLESKRELNICYRWLERGYYWVFATGGAFAVGIILRYGPYGHPAGGTPWWIVASLITIIGLPAFVMLGIAMRHLVRSSRARRREVDEGQVRYTNRIVAWVDYHGLGVGWTIVAVILALSFWLTLRSG